MTRLAQTYPQLALQLADAGWSSSQLARARSAYDLAGLLLGASVRGSGKPFVDHLVGTASGVLLGGGAPDAVAAALLHAAYELGDFGDTRPGAHPAHRRRVRAAVGRDVEDLIFRYHQLRWTPAVATSFATSAAVVTASERAVLLIRVANEVDDAVDGGLVLSTKGRLAEHTPSVHRSVVVVAERVATADLAGLARDLLLTPPPSFPPELVIGGGGSRQQLPLSARRRLRIRALHAGRVGRRMLRHRLAPLGKPSAG